MRALQRRWRVAVGVFVIVCAAVAVFVVNRKHEIHPVVYASSASVRVAPPPAPANGNSRTTTTTAPAIALSGPAQLAMGTDVRNAALAASQLPANDPRIGFDAQITPAQDVVTLHVTAPTSEQAFTVAQAWTKAFIDARNVDATQSTNNQINDIKRTINTLHSTLFAVDLRLQALVPKLINSLTTYDFNPSGAKSGDASALPPICETCKSSVYLLNLWNERTHLITSLNGDSNALADLSVQQSTPGAFAEPLAQTPAVRITKPVHTLIPAGIALLVGLLLALAAAVIVDKLDRRIRDPEDAAAAFAAPVLSVLPWEPESVEVVSKPDSLAAEEYRALAALAIATDRLPRAVMVTSPTGDTYEEVAANLAAALSGLGLKVALLATSPEQDWYLKELNGSEDHSRHKRLPELLMQAHSGALGGLQGELAVSDKAPNLSVVPPADQPMAHMRIDGLPALLVAISDSGVDVTVVSGPAILDQADATIFAWTTRSVLWAIGPGEITKAQARAATARMELSGVTSFGVVMTASARNTAWRQ
jgi:Mrp family chromosome partitioning ATPase